MLRFALNLFHRPAYRFGLSSDARGRFRDPRFASFMAQSNRRAYGSDLQDVTLRGRKLARSVFTLALVGGAAWLLLESAKALTVF